MMILNIHDFDHIGVHNKFLMLEVIYKYFYAWFKYIWMLIHDDLHDMYYFYLEK